MPESLSEKDVDTTNQFMDASSEYKKPNFVKETSDNEDADETWIDESDEIVGQLTGSMEDLERIQATEFIMSEEVRECIQDNLDCFRICNQTLVRCLSIGGKHSEIEHVNLIIDCARICDTNADFMLRNSTYYPQTCGLTADICDECADTCDRFEDDFMKECASVCRRCAESCREMAR